LTQITSHSFGIALTGAQVTHALLNNRRMKKVSKKLEMND